jgi:hypothetical protein
MAVTADDFQDPTPLPDEEQIKVPTTARPDQSPDTSGLPGPGASTGSPADALHPERTQAIIDGKDPDAAKAAPKTDPGSPGLVDDGKGGLKPNPKKK